jgi:sugar phosphate isomerase/epimerase
MLFGAMNNPTCDALKQMEHIADLGFDFIDLTLEPPCTEPSKIDVAQIKDMLRKLHLKVVVHSAYYLPFNNPFLLVRKSAVEEYKKVIEVAGKLEALSCNLHFDSPFGLFSSQDLIQWYLEALEILIPVAAVHHTVLVLENAPHKGQMERITKVLEKNAEVYLHLDVGHAFIEGWMASIEKYFRLYGHRIRHVHISENDGTADQHLPLESNPQKAMDWEKIFRWFRQYRYDDTVTLEVFHGPKEGLRESLWKARKFYEMSLI